MRAAPPDKPPDLAATAFSQALSHQNAGKTAEAERLYRDILAQQPEHPQSLHMLGVLALQAKRFADAYGLLALARPALHDRADLHRHLGIALQGLGRHIEAAAAYREAIKLQPDYVSCNNLGTLLQDHGDPAGALAAFTQAVELRPDSAEIHNNLGVALKYAGRFQEAATAFDRALQLRPDYADAHTNAGIALQENGRPAEARAAFERALAVDPGHAHAWLMLSDLKPLTADEIAQLETLQIQPARSAKAHSELAFALGRALMDAGDADAAFERFDCANRLKRATFAYSVDRDIAQMFRFADLSGNEPIQRIDGATLPIFILGMPRSGTTLVEQILASHPAITGGGELPILPEIVARVLGPDSLQPTTLREMGDDYMRQVAALSSGRPFLTDKAIGNFRYAGLIHLMLPGARLIHCRRDPVDTCFSCFTHNFTERQNFAYDQRELGLYYRAYARLMAHWRDVLPPEHFLEIDYEAIVTDLKCQAKRLIAFCGLEWDESCLSFYRNERRVSTASVNQVRRPLYRSSIGAWRPYARHLEPLLTALTAASP